MDKTLFRHKDSKEEHTKDEWLDIYKRIAGESWDEMIPSEAFDNDLNEGILAPVPDNEKGR